MEAARDMQITIIRTTMEASGDSKVYNTIIGVTSLRPHQHHQSTFHSQNFKPQLAPSTFPIPLLLNFHHPPFSLSRPLRYLFHFSGQRYMSGFILITLVSATSTHQPLLVEHNHRQPETPNFPSRPWRKLIFHHTFLNYYTYSIDKQNHNPLQEFSPNNLQPKPQRQNGHARPIRSFM